jgi:hypothetical protein
VIEFLLASVSLTPQHSQKKKTLEIEIRFFTVHKGLFNRLHPHVLKSIILLSVQILSSLRIGVAMGVKDSELLWT